MASLKIQLLLTGNELMAGDIVDSNSAMIAQELKLLGLEIYRKVSVADDLSQLVEEINHISKNADVLIINGGLGPTIDDLTAEALAKATQVPLIQHSDALTHIQAWCVRRNYPLNKPNLKQTILPQGCEIIPNKQGSAVGFKLTLNKCKIMCTPGVPFELKDMLHDAIIPSLSNLVPTSDRTHVTRLQVFGLGESTIQLMIDENFPHWPQDIELGFRASMPLLEVKLTTRSTMAKDVKLTWLEKLKGLLGDHILGEITDTPKSISRYVIELLDTQNKKITTAESCTGGMIASHLTKESGASRIFEAGFITYSNTIKTKLLNVDPQIIEQYGAVSEQTVLAMALGALEKSGADYVMSVSGIAGPNGGTENKPVGTVWIAWGTKNTLQTTCLLLPGTRGFFQQYTTAICLDLIRRMLIKSNQTPKYLIDRRKIDK